MLLRQLSCAIRIGGFHAQKGPIAYPYGIIELMASAAPQTCPRQGVNQPGLNKLEFERLFSISFNGLKGGVNSLGWS